jgi:hypothetical protein
MKCSIDNNRQEITLKDAKFSDVIAVIQIWLNKNKEICFSRPQAEKEDE